MKDHDMEGWEVRLIQRTNTGSLPRSADWLVRKQPAIGWQLPKVSGTTHNNHACHRSHQGGVLQRPQRHGQTQARTTSLGAQ